MLFFVGLSALLCAALYKQYYRSWINPGSMFLALWGLILCLYSLRLFSIYDVDNLTIWVFCLGIISFAIGCIPVSFRFGSIPLYKDYSVCEQAFAFRSKTRMFFLGASIVAVVVLAIRAVNTLPFWSGGAFAVKQANAEGYITYSSWISILYTFFASPIETLSVFVIAVDFFFNRSSFSKLQATLTALMIFFGYIASASKFALFVPVLAFGVTFYVYLIFIRHEDAMLLKLTGWKKILIITISFMILGFLIYMLNQKYGGWAESLYMYLVGCIPCGGHAISSMHDGEYYYGMVSLNGVFRVLSQIFSFVGIKLPFSDFLNEAYSAMLTYERAINISPTVSYNAFISAFSYFYKDGGLLGVVLGSLIFGRICSCVYCRLIRERSAYSILLYLFISYLILFSIVRMQLFLAPTVMVLVYMVLFFRRKS